MYKNMRKRSIIVLHGVVHAVDQGKDAHQQEQPQNKQILRICLTSLGIDHKLQLTV